MKQFSEQQTVSCLKAVRRAEPQSQAALRTALRALASTDANKTHKLLVDRQATRWLTQARVFVPLGAVSLVILVGGGFAWHNLKTIPAKTTSQSIAPNGSLSNANAALLQDSSEEASQASQDDGSVQIYTTSASSLQGLGEAANASF